MTKGGRAGFIVYNHPNKTRIVSQKSKFFREHNPMKGISIFDYWSKHFSKNEVDVKKKRIFNNNLKKIG